MSRPTIARESVRRCSLLRYAILIVLAGAIAGCAEERPPINRVQPNAIEKSTFIDSEWYALSTVIDTPGQTTAAFVGESSTLDKIVWEIQEDFLIARSKRQHIDNIENGAIAGDGTIKGNIVAMYPIESHFDIRREYNQNTGEEFNILTENTTDRPWYERDHFRVEWADNQVANQDLTVTSAFGGVELIPANYSIESPEHPLGPYFAESADGEVDYFDVVNRVLASPEMVTLTSGQEIPSCYLTFGRNVPCEPAEIAVRTAFMRVKPDRDYQPQIYSSDRMDRAGYFLTWRDSYDPAYGATSGRRLRFVNRHNLWEASHQRDEGGAFVTCGSDADCERFGAGSVCDVTIAHAKQLAAGQCTIPFRERQVKPIAYHLSEGFPDDLIPDVQAFAEGWNDAFQQTVGSLRALECEEAGGTREECAAERNRDDAKSVYVICANPVTEGDPEACGEPGTIARIGDLRFNHIAWVPEVTEGPLGYGPSFADPETGEIVSASAYVYGAEVVRLSSYARDLLALINGDLEEEDVIDNDAFAAWLSAVRSGSSFVPAAREAANHAVEVDAWNVQDINSSMNFDWLHDAVDARGTRPPITRETAFERFEEESARVIDAVAELRLGDQARANASLLRGTDIERLMVDDEMRLAAGLSPVDPVGDADVQKASPLQGMSLDKFREVDELRRQISGAPNSCVLNADFVDQGLIGLVEEMNRAITSRNGIVTWYGVDYDIARRSGSDIVGIDYGRVATMLRHPIFNAVTAHEVGHTLGLRHNFSGSYDSLNYHPRYWELRSDDNVLPRAWDPMTKREIEGRIREYQYSTVMDYGNNFVVTDAEGIGHYDVAAIKLGYGDLVEVFENVPEQNKALVGQLGALRRFGWPGAIDLVNWDPAEPLISVPYTRMPELLGGRENLEARADVRYNDLGPHPELTAIGIRERVIDGEDRLAVPYRYCGDEFADYEPTCLRYDAGADEYESLTSVVDTYWNYYLLNNFMRQRIGFDPDAVPGTVYSRYFAKLEDANLYYSYYRGFLRSYNADDDFYERQDGFGAYTLGVGASYQLLTKVIATPEPGCHEQALTFDGELVFTPGTSVLCEQNPQNRIIADFDGRELRTGYSLGPDSSFWYRTRAGYFQDKVLALQVLTDPGARVLGQDTNVDIRRFQVSFYTTFQEPIQEILRGVASRDWKPFAPRLTADGLVFPTADEQSTSTAEGILIDPNLSFALELYSMVFGMAYLPRTFDYRFIDRGRLFVRGAAESVDIELGEDRTMVEFVDPESGLVYMAPSYPDAEGRETGIAASVLNYAQALKDEGATSALNAWMANVNVLRRLTYVMGFGGSDQQYLE